MINQESLSLGQTRSVIRELFEYGNQRAKVVGRENIFDFSIGNPSVPPPPQVSTEIERLIREMEPCLLHGYTSAAGDPEVRTRIASSLSRRFAIDCKGEELYLTCGAAASLVCCLHALSEPGDEVVLIAPYFPEYVVFIRAAGGVVKICPADTDTFQINFQKLESLLTQRTKAVIINSPNNPSGVLYDEKTLTYLGELLGEKSRALGQPIYLISDEPYREIVFGGKTAPWIPHFYPNTIVCYSWSKSLSLPGERIGYVYVPASAEQSKEVYSAIVGAGRKLGYVCAPSLIQRLVAACCDLTADLSVYEKNARILTHSLRNLGYTCVVPGGTFYLFPKSLDEDDVAFARAAQKMDLLLVPGSSFGCPGHVRISYCVPPEQIERSLAVFSRLAKKYLRG